MANYISLKPQNPNEGDIFYDTINNTAHLYHEYQWVQIGIDLPLSGKDYTPSQEPKKTIKRKLKQY